MAEIAVTLMGSLPVESFWGRPGTLSRATKLGEAIRHQGGEVALGLRDVGWRAEGRAGLGYKFRSSWHRDGLEGHRLDGVTQGMR